MLDDKDRVFKNLYGVGDWGLKGARARGAWDGTKQILDKGRDGVVSEMKASGQRGRGEVSADRRRPAYCASGCADRGADVFTCGRL